MAPPSMCMLDCCLHIIVAFDLYFVQNNIACVVGAKLGTFKHALCIFNRGTNIDDYLATRVDKLYATGIISI